MIAFVTGGTGLLGSNLIALLLAQGFEVKALARSRQKADQMLGKHERLHIIVGDMENVGGFAAELAGVDVLFHTAAYFREVFTSSADDHWPILKKINVDGTLRILNEAEQRGVKKTVYVSSATVIGAPTSGNLSDETALPDESIDGDLYAKSKMLAEREIAGWLKAHQMPVVLILPSAIFGPQDAAPTVIGQTIIDLLGKRIPVVPPGGIEMVDARDVAQAMLNAVECGKSGERYIVSAGFHMMRELTQVIEQVSGVPGPKINIPFPMMMGMAWTMEHVAALQHQTPRISVASLRAIRRTRRLTSQKAVRELGINFRSFQDTIRDEAAWFRANGYV